MHIDFEPLFIEGDRKWVHPNVSALAGMQEHLLDDLDVRPIILRENTKPVYRVYIVGEDQRPIFIVFKSRWFDRLIKQVAADKRAFDLTDGEREAFLAAIWVVLLEDVYVPAGVQFMHYEIYQELVHRLRAGFVMDFLSADCYLVCDEDGTYTFES